MKKKEQFMKIAWMLIMFVLLGSCFLVGCSNNTLPPISSERMSGILRSTVEKMPEEKRGPTLAYLDRARPVAEKGILCLVDEDMEELYSLMVSEYEKNTARTIWQKRLSSRKISLGKLQVMNIETKVSNIQ